MKAFFILGLLALVASSASAQYDTHGQGYGEQTQWQAIEPCRQFLLQQCGTVAGVPFIRSHLWELSSCQVMQQQCCRQLAQLTPPYRCQAVCATINQVTMQQQQQRGLFSYMQPLAEGQQILRTQQVGRSLPAMCGLYPSHCNCATSFGACAATGDC